MNQILNSVSSLLLLATAAQAQLTFEPQLVFEPQIVGWPTGQTYLPRLDVGDVDHDGDVDAVVFTGAESLFFAYEVMLNDGTGKLTPALKVPVTQVFNALRLSDLDADDRLDLVYAHGDAIRMRKGNGNGTFGAPQLVYAPTAASSCRMEVAELSGDTAPDLVALLGGLVAVLPGVGDGTVGIPIQLADLLVQSSYAARAADLDGDGGTDLVILARDDALPQAPTCEAHVFRANGPAAFATLGTYVLGANADIELVSLDEDGRADLICASETGLTVSMGLGTGEFAAPVVLDSGAFGTGVACTDFDGDSYPDLASVRSDSGQLVFWRGNGEDGFVAGLDVSGADSFNVEGEQPFVMRPLIVADMNGDGRPDLVRTAGDTFGQVHISVFINHTYLPGEPFIDLGHSLSDPGLVGAGDAGEPGLMLATPILLLDGSLQAGTELRLRVMRQGVETDRAFLILGFDPLFMPMAGGVLVPLPAIVIGPLVLPTSHAVANMTTIMPPGLPSGFQFWMQAWFAPTTPFQDFAATSAVQVTAP